MQSAERSHAHAVHHLHVWFTCRSGCNFWAEADAERTSKSSGPVPPEHSALGICPPDGKGAPKTELACHLGPLSCNVTVRFYLSYGAHCRVACRPRHHTQPFGGLSTNRTIVQTSRQQEQCEWVAIRVSRPQLL